MKGTVFAAAYEATKPGDQAARDELVLDAALRQQSWIVWPMSHIAIGHRGATIGFTVANDYFAIGEPDDYVRVPVNARTAQTLADRLGFVLPTPKMVDLIWMAATWKLQPLAAGSIGVTLGLDQQSGRAAVKHSRAVDSQLGASMATAGLRAGCKKDIIISNRLGDPPQKMPGSIEGMAWNRDGVGIYGWHLPKGSSPCQISKVPGLCPIQGESWAHHWPYADYSHGVRMVAPEVLVDGAARTLVSVLADPELGKALAHDAPMRVFRYGGPAVGGGGTGGGAKWCQGFVSSCAEDGDASAAPLVLGAMALGLVTTGLYLGGYW